MQAALAQTISKTKNMKKIVATLSQQLSWSHFVEFIILENDRKGNSM